MTSRMKTSIVVVALISLLLIPKLLSFTDFELCNFFFFVIGLFTVLLTEIAIINKYFISEKKVV